MNSQSKTNLHRWLFRVHAWLGLITGLFLLLLGLSGSALVFMREQDRWLERQRLTVQPRATPLSLDTLYERIAKRYPTLDGMAWINPDRPANEAYDFRLYLNDTRLSTYDLGIISLNQYTGAVLREGRSDEFRAGLMAWLFQFHFSFQLGVPGAALTASFGLTMILSMLTGLIVYRKFIGKVLLFRVRLNRKNWRTLSSSLHRIVGVWSLLFNIVIFFTGFWLNKFAFDRAVWQTETQPTPTNVRPAQSLTSMYAKARRVMPLLRPNRVYLPTQPTRSFSVSGYEAGHPDFLKTAVTLNNQTAAVEKIVTFDRCSVGEKLEALVYPLHAGNYGGWPLKVLYMLVGLTPGLLSLTGFILWWRRVRRAPQQAVGRRRSGVRPGRRPATDPADRL